MRRERAVSIRTIFEINHDYTHAIKANPEEFVALLTRYLNSAGDDAALPLERYGIRLAWWGHHSADRKVVSKYAEKTL
jgi:hypothetical protein